MFTFKTITIKLQLNQKFLQKSPSKGPLYSQLPHGAEAEHVHFPWFLLLSLSVLRVVLAKIANYIFIKLQTFFDLVSASAAEQEEQARNGEEADQTAQFVLPGSNQCQSYAP